MNSDITKRNYLPLIRNVIHEHEAIQVTAQGLKEIGSDIVTKTDGLAESIDTHVRKEVNMLQLIGKGFKA